MTDAGNLQNTLSAQTLEQLIGWLKKGTFKPGSKLPSQNELIEKFGISRTGIREALQAMKALDLIEIRPGLGCFVKRVSSEHLINTDVLAILLEKEAILEVIETRKIMEAGIAALAAERASEEDYWLMEDVLTRLEKAIERGESVAAVGMDFHYAVAKATHNVVLAKLQRSFHQLMSKGGELIEKTVADLNAFRQGELISHRKLYEVLRQGNPNKARQAMVQHITDTEALIIEAFRSAEGVEE